jgi:hypothetical protein
MKRAGGSNLDRLFTLREVELDSGNVTPDEAREIRAQLSLLRGALERLRSTGRNALRQTRLAIGGREVMEILGVGSGPLVGRALRYLTQQVGENPGCNSEDELRELLRAWREIEP